MELLTIDTTKTNAIIGLTTKNLQYFAYLDEGKKHSENLLNEIDLLLNKQNVSISQIETLGCVTGPGSFTGIRIGMATIKAFSFALNIPVVSANYFEVVADLVKNGYVVLKNTSTSVYLCQIIKGKTQEIEVVNCCDILNKVQGGNVFVSEYEHIEELESYKNTMIINEFDKLMQNHFESLVEKGKFVKSAKFVPTYAQLSQAERNEQS